MTADELRGI